MKFEYPAVMADYLKTDHAGETGAVAIYETIIRFARDREMSLFAERHLKSEKNHLGIFEALLQKKDKSLLLFLWKTGGTMIVILSAVAGKKWIYAVVETIESMVIRHYDRQLYMLASINEDGNYTGLYQLLKKCREDEVVHRDEASGLCSGRTFMLGLWCGMVKAFSEAALFITKKI